MDIEKTLNDLQIEMAVMKQQQASMQKSQDEMRNIQEKTLENIATSAQTQERLNNHITVFKTHMNYGKAILVAMWGFIVYFIKTLTRIP